MNWYYVQQGQQAGPVDDAQLDQLRASGGIQDDTLIWSEGMANWQAYREIKGGAPAPAAGGLRLSSSPAAATAVAAEAVCAECGGIFPKENMIRYGNAHVCANCKPVFMQKLAEGARLNTGGLNYAGFWIRFAAKFLDGLIVGVVLIIPLVILIVVFASGTRSTNSFNWGDNSLHAAGGAKLIGNLFGLFFQFLFLGANVLYSTFFLGKYGATPGKMACKLIVVDPSGGKISYGRAFGRSCAEILSRLICSIGYIIAAFDGEKRALHDHMCGTRVVYK